MISMPNKPIDLTGRIVNGVTVLRPTKKRMPYIFIWECRCHCGNIFETAGSNIRRGVIKSCGCLNADVVAIYKKILNGDLQEFPPRTWRPKEKGLVNAQKVTKYLFDEHLGWTKEDIAHFANSGTFKDFKLRGMISYLFGNCPVDAIENAYPGIFHDIYIANGMRNRRQKYYPLDFEVERVRAMLKGCSRDEVLTIFRDANFVSKHALQGVLKNISRFELLDLVFPNEYKSWELRTASTFWNTKENRVVAMFWMMDRLGKMCITSTDFENFRLRSLIRHYKPPRVENALKEALHVPTSSSFMKFVLMYQSKLGLSNDELADKIGISKNTYLGWKAGYIKPSFSTIIKMCDRLNINLRKSAYDSFEAAIKDL